MLSLVARLSLLSLSCWMLSAASVMAQVTLLHPIICILIIGFSITFPLFSGPVHTQMWYCKGTFCVCFPSLCSNVLHLQSTWVCQGIINGTPNAAHLWVPNWIVLQYHAIYFSVFLKVVYTQHSFESTVNVPYVGIPIWSRCELAFSAAD